MTLGDRIAVLKDGEVQQVARPLEIYNDPRNTFVAGFLGTPPMNLLHARVLKKGKMTFLVTGDMELAVPQEMLTSVRALQDKSFTLGIRPEDIDVTTMKPKGNNMKIRFIEHLGNELLLHFQLDNQEILVTVSQDKCFKEGDIVTLDIHLERIHLFDNQGNKIKG
ncbi:MAG: TOBE domain-containing protein [candidate division WOR-3 bacterium]|nr:MAG: TOBE domain-containing protein [candidate division WOR-3 bacterium]